jgi:hypothetical protein
VPQGSHPERGTSDPDDYSSGFGVWSGTSFSAPAFVGELACLLAKKPLDKVVKTRVSTLRRLVKRCIGGTS